MPVEPTRSQNITVNIVALADGTRNDGSILAGILTVSEADGDAGSVSVSARRSVIASRRTLAMPNNGHAQVLQVLRRQTGQ